MDVHGAVLSELDTIMKQCDAAQKAFAVDYPSGESPYGIQNDIQSLIYLVSALARLVATHIRTENYMGEHRYGE